MGYVSRNANLLNQLVAPLESLSICHLNAVSVRLSFRGECRVLIASRSNLNLLSCPIRVRSRQQIPYSLSLLIGLFPELNLHVVLLDAIYPLDKQPLFRHLYSERQARTVAL